MSLSVAFVELFLRLFQNFTHCYVLSNTHGNDDHGHTSHLWMIKINILSKMCLQQENATHLFRFFFQVHQVRQQFTNFSQQKFFFNFSDDVCIPVDCCPVNTL